MAASMPMSPEDAFFLPDGASQFVATEWTRGPWDPRHQHGGPPAALVLRAMESAAAESGPFQLARLTVEFLRAVPIDRCAVDLRPARSSRRTLGLEATLAAAGRPCVRALGLFVRRADVPVPPELAVADAAADPLAVPALEFSLCERVGYYAAMEMRAAPGSSAAWLRLRGRLVAGEEASPAQRVAVAADEVNGVGIKLDFASYTFANADLTLYLHREPEPPWVLLRATHLTQPYGRGLVDAELADPRGPIGRALETQVLDRRAAST